MGQQGVDIILSPRAGECFDHAIECKKYSKIAVSSIFAKHFAKYKDKPSLKLMFFEADRGEAMVTLRADDFMSIVEELLSLQDNDSSLSS